MQRTKAHDRLRDVTTQYSVALKTVQTVIELAKLHLDELRARDLDLKMLKILSLQLHDIYFARFFACFENILRDYWKSGLNRTSKPLTKDLLTSIAAKRKVPQDTEDFVQDIRDFRNSLVHDEHEVLRSFTMEEASPHLHSFLSRLPDQW